MPLINRKLSSHITLFLLLVFTLLLAACTNSQSTQAYITSTKSVPSDPSISLGTVTISSTQTLKNSAAPTSNSQVDPSSTINPIIIPGQSTTFSSDIPSATPSNDWMSLPITPTISLTARSIYRHGLELGNDPHAFSKIGDCQSITTYFLSYFDMPGYYDLGAYSPLQSTIDWYAGSFLRESLAVKGGFNAAAVLSPLRADPKQCNANESPVACEFRLHRPSIAIISLEEWWAGHPENYETYLRQIIEYAIKQGAVPILATKADNLEGNNLINQTIAKLAKEYDVPLWNFWSAVQPLPNHGLIAFDSKGAVDMFHLTHSEGYYFYNDPSGTQSGWSVRNLTALQALDAIRRGLTHQP